MCLKAWNWVRSFTILTGRYNAENLRRRSWRFTSSPGSNAVDAANGVRARLKELGQKFPMTSPTR